MKKINLLRKLNKALSPNKVDYSSLDNEVSALKKKLEETVHIQTLDDVSSKLKQFQSKIDLEPIIREIRVIGDSFVSKTREIFDEIEIKEKEIASIEDNVSVNDKASKEREKELRKEIEALKASVLRLGDVQVGDFKFFAEEVETIKQIEGKVNEKIAELSQNIDTKISNVDAEKSVKEINEALEDLRRDVLGKISNIGGGSMNRQIFINSADPLTKYTDINLKPGSNVTITYTNNNTTKKVDVTISSTGGSGTTRSVNTISTDTNAGDTDGTDYVYICSDALTLTLPTALDNTNLYTVKNASNGTITIATTGGDTVDGDANLLLPVRFTSVDLISNGTSDWQIT